jgi:hypothetical protein
MDEERKTFAKYLVSQNLFSIAWGYRVVAHEGEANGLDVACWNMESVFAAFPSHYWNLVYNFSPAVHHRGYDMIRWDV